jgi:hypothetical protein
MTTNPTSQELLTSDAAAVLDLFGYEVARITSSRIYLATPASALNASDLLRRNGYDSVARSNGQWHVEVAG